MWEDRNAMGKSAKIHLVRLHGALCLGVIGADERRVCRMTAVSCKIGGHRKTKLVLACAEAYCIPAKRQCSTGHPAAFKFPLLDESKMTPEVRKFVEEHGPKTARTTREWETYVPQALMEFDLQERGLGVGIPKEKSDKNEDNESRGGLSLGNIPSLMSWDTSFEAPELGVGLGLSQFAFEEASRRQEVNKELKKLADGLQKLGDQACKDSKDVLNYLWLSVHEVANKVNQVNSRLCVLQDNVGDATPLSELYNIDDLAEGVVKALGCVGAGELEEMGNAITTLDTGLSYVTGLMGDVDKDHQGAAMYVLSKANEMSLRIGLLEVSVGVHPPVNSKSLAHNALISDSFCVPVASMAKLWRLVSELKASNLALTTRMSELTVEVLAQGGVVLGNMTFTSEA